MWSLHAFSVFAWVPSGALVSKTCMLDPSPVRGDQRISVLCPGQFTV